MLLLLVLLLSGAAAALGWVWAGGTTGGAVGFIKDARALSCGFICNSESKAAGWRPASGFGGTAGWTLEELEILPILLLFLDDDVVVRGSGFALFQAATASWIELFLWCVCRCWC